MNEDSIKLKVLLEQLSHLNQRSRWYTAQLWQVPFAYLGLSGLAIGAALKDGVSNLALAGVALASSAFGFAVFKHICGVRDAENRAICNLMLTEKAIKNLVGPIDDEILLTAQRGDGDSFPLKVAVLVAAFFFFLIAVLAGEAALRSSLCHCWGHF